MRPLISEFSFGYTLIEELVERRHGSLRGAPVFPTQNQEGIIGGYDVELPFSGIPLFLQFKLSDYLSRRSANEWNNFHAPYYRMHIRPLRFSKQHNLLLNWETLGNEVYYVAPEFYEQDELNQFYLSHNVIEHSAFFSPGDIGLLPDHLDHYVAFQREDTIGWFYSEKKRKIEKRFYKGKVFNYFSSLVNVKKHKIDFEFLETKAAELIEFLEENNEDVSRLKSYDAHFGKQIRKTRKEAAIFLSYLIRTYFDAVLLFLTDEEYDQEINESNE